MNISVFQILAIVFFVIAFVLMVISITIFFTQDIASVIGFLSGRTEKKQIEQIRNQTTNISYGARKSSSSNKSVYDNVLGNSSNEPVVNVPNNQGQAHQSKRLGRKAKGFVEQPEIVNTFKAGVDSGTVSLDNIDDDVAISKTDTLGTNKPRVNKTKSNDDIPTDVLSSDDVPTDVLSSDDVPTDVLSSDDVPTDVLSSDDVPTDVLSSDDMPTDVLSSDDEGTTLLSDDEGTTVLSNDEEVVEGFEIIDDQTFTNTDEVIG